MTVQPTPDTRPDPRRVEQLLGPAGHPSWVDRAFRAVQEFGPWPKSNPDTIRAVLDLWAHRPMLTEQQVGMVVARVTGLPEPVRISGDGDRDQPHGAYPLDRTWIGAAQPGTRAACETCGRLVEYVVRPNDRETYGALAGRGGWRHVDAAASSSADDSAATAEVELVAALARMVASWRRDAHQLDPDARRAVVAYADAAGARALALRLCAGELATALRRAAAGTARADDDPEADADGGWDPPECTAGALPGEVLTCGRLRPCPAHDRDRAGAS